MFLLYYGGSTCIELLSYIGDLKISNKSDKFIIIDKKPQKKKFNKFKFSLSFKTTITEALKYKFKKIYIASGDPKQRDRALAELKNHKLKPNKLIHPTAYIGFGAQISNGVIMAPFTLVAPFAKIGENTFLNSYASIGHHTTIGKSNVLSPYSTINGNCKIGNENFFGTGAIINPSTRIGNANKISSNSVLKSNVANYNLIHGNPAKSKLFF